MITPLTLVLLGSQTLRQGVRAGADRRGGGRQVGLLDLLQAAIPHLHHALRLTRHGGRGHPDI